MSKQHSILLCEKGPVVWNSFQYLTESEMRLVNDNKYEATFKTGEIMLKQGAPTSNALFLINGMAKTYIESNNGKNFIISIALPGQLIIGPGAYINSRHSYTAAALIPVNACFVSFDILKQLVRDNGTFAESLLKDISSKAVQAHYRMVNLTQKKMHGRLAEALLYLADAVYHSDEYEMVLSRMELGELTNMAKECVVRILKDLEDSGLIYSDSSKIKILDREKLIKISEKG